MGTLKQSYMDHHGTKEIEAKPQTSSTAVQMLLDETFFVLKQQLNISKANGSLYVHL